jgi:hypothetical protein
MSRVRYGLFGDCKKCTMAAYVWLPEWPFLVTFGESDLHEK